MLQTLFSRIADPQTRSLALAAAGVGALVLGRKGTAISMFSSGVRGLEKIWREKNDFNGSLAERWRRAETFYEATHKQETNRLLHMVGIPIIVGGTVGLFAFKPFGKPWVASASAFAFGWTLNFIGHAVEGSAPAFAADPLSFVAGPVWDLKQIGQRMRGVKVRTATESDAAQPAAASA